MQSRKRSVKFRCIGTLRPIYTIHLHDSRIRFLSWRMKTIADATILLFIDQFMVKFEM
jgi:hypothetical protein